MEAEAFPGRFTKGIRSYWRRRKYKLVDAGGAAGGRSARHLARLGDGGGSSRPWAVRLSGMFRTRVKATATARPARVKATATTARPARVLGRLRDAYVDAMLGAARKQQPAAALARTTGPAPDALWQKRVPVRRSRGQAQARQKAEELGQKLVDEMYKSVRASRDLTGMLHASTAAAR